MLLLSGFGNTSAPDNIDGKNSQSYADWYFFLLISDYYLQLNTIFKSNSLLLFTHSV